MKSSTKGLIAVALLILLYSIFSCQSEPVKDVPGELQGTWITGAPRYADRYVEFTSDSVIFGTGEYTYDTYVIVDIRKENEASRTLYDVSYKEPGGVNYKLTFYYDPESGGLITFKNQQHLIWARERG